MCLKISYNSISLARGTINVAARLTDDLLHFHLEREIGLQQNTSY